MRAVARGDESEATARQVAADFESAVVAACDIDLIGNAYACEERARLEEPSPAGLRRADHGAPRLATIDVERRRVCR
jgi:hypothetical protein